MLGKLLANEIKPLVIFGAGASFDFFDETIDKSINRFQFRPPLTDNIFDYRCFNEIQLDNRYNLIRGLFGIIRDRINNKQSLEDAIESAIFNGEVSEQELEILKNYLGHLFLKVSNENQNRTGNNYEKFFKLLNHVCKKFTVVNFNYDFLAEKALWDSRMMPIKDINSYIDSDIKLIQIHGSVTWAENHKDGISRIVAGNRTNIEGKNLIAIPIAGTTSKHFVCPLKHIEVLGKYMSEVNVIIIIGWKGTENHFNNMIKSVGEVERIIIVGGEKDEYKKIINNIGFRDKIIDSDTTVVYVEGFSKFLKKYTDFSVYPKNEDFVDLF